jgi:DNA-directed RNA polymerase specialized sigma24 family protein
VDFAEDYRLHRSHGLTHDEIAKIMGYAPKSVGRLCTRARHAGLLPAAVTP